VIGTSDSDVAARQRYKGDINREVRDFLTKKVPGPNSSKTPAEAVEKLLNLLSLKTFLPLSRENFFKDAAIAAANEYRSEITSAMSIDTGRVYPAGTDVLPSGLNPLHANLKIQPAPDVSTPGLNSHKSMKISVVAPEKPVIEDPLLTEVRQFKTQLTTLSNDSDKLSTLSTLLENFVDDDDRHTHLRECIRKLGDPEFTTEFTRLMKLDVAITELTSSKKLLDQSGLDRLDAAMATISGAASEKESTLLTIVSHRNSSIRGEVQDLLKLKTLVSQFGESATDPDRMRALRGIVDLGLVPREISALFPGVNGVADLIDLTERITYLVDHEISIPVSRDHITANLEAVRRCMPPGWEDRGADVQKLVPLVMAYFNDQIEVANAARRDEQVERLTQRKFACAASFIEVTRGNAGEKWSTYLPKPSHFGLVRGYEVRDRRASDGKSRPVVPTNDGRLVANNRKTLGEGSFGKVKTATTLRGEYALKRISLHDKKLDNVDYEIFLDMAKEAHYAQTFSRESPNMLNVQDFWVYDDGKHAVDGSGHRPPGHVSKFAMKMEVASCDGLGVAGSKTLSIYNKLNYMLDLANGLNAMHRAGYAHNDFKLGNSVQGSGGVGKVVDFGFVAPLHVESSTIFPLWKVGGTFPSPEALAVREGRAHVSTVDFAKGDVSAFGTALAQMAVCAWNGIDPNLSHLYKPIDVANAFKASGQPPHNVALGQLISDCVHADPEWRPTMAQVVARLQAISIQY